MKRSLIALASVAIASNLGAVGIAFQGGLLYDESGVSGSAAGSQAILIASTQDSIFAASDSFIDPSGINVGDFLTETGGVLSDDLVIGRASFFSAGNVGISLTGVTFTSIDSSWNQGDPLGVMWFPEAVISDSVVSSGMRFGFFSSDTALDGGSSYITPTESSDITIFAKTASGGAFGSGSLSAAELTASGLVGIPEPSTYAALFGLGVLGLAILRRRR